MLIVVGGGRLSHLVNSDLVRENPHPSPLHTNILVQTLTLSRLKRVSGVTRIVSGHHHQIIEVVGLNVLSLHLVQVVRLGVSQLRPRPPRRELGGVRVTVQTRVNVVQSDIERAHPNLAQLLKLSHRGVIVTLLAITNVVTGGEGKHKIHVVSVSGIHQLLKLSQLRLRIQLTPLSAQISVILRGVNVGIHLVLARESQNILASLVRPGNTVKTLNRAAHTHQRPVAHRGVIELAVFNQLTQRLHAIVSAARIRAGNSDAITLSFKQVALSVLRGLASAVALLTRSSHLNRDLQRGRSRTSNLQIIGFS